MKCLGDLILPDSLQWSNRWEWSPVAQETARTLGGTLVTWSQPLTGGQPITLEVTDDAAWLTLAQVEALFEIASQSGAVFQLVWESETFDVLFRHHDPPAISFTPIRPYHTLYTGTIRLSTKYRKCFIKEANDNDLGLISPRVFVETFTPGDDRILIFAGTQTNTQNDITGSERLYGCGSLNANISAGASTCTVLCESGSDAIFQNGDMIRISNKTSVNDTGGSEEFLTLASSGGVSWNGDVAIPLPL